MCNFEIKLVTSKLKLDFFLRHMLSLCLYGIIESDILQNMLICYICEYVPSEDVMMTYRRVYRLE